ncbi:MAG: prepilin peptidase, partial [Anaerolineales bacterium]|nr:prepilin peptidase [Anaerolineales bacterium]
MDILIGLLGLILGAAINGLADSLPRSRRLQRPHCRACGAPRPPRAWSSLLGLAMGARRCAYCGISQAWRAPVLEILAVAGSLWLFHRDPASTSFWKGMLVSTVFLLVVVMDLEHRLIPHVVTGPAAIAFALVGVFDPSRGLLKTLAGGLVGLGLFYVLYLLGGV